MCSCDYLLAHGKHLRRTTGSGSDGFQGSLIGPQPHHSDPRPWSALSVNRGRSAHLGGPDQGAYDPGGRKTIRTIISETRRPTVGHPP
jgi:hypothetical protein